MKLPAMPPAAAPAAADAASVIDEATRDCRTIRTLTAEVAASGKVGGQRVRVKLSLGVSRPASARIEAVAPFGPPIFIFVADGADATLLLPRDDRVLEHGEPDHVLDAAAGVPLTAAELRTTLTGCLAEADRGALVAAGDDWRVWRGGADEAYLHRDPSARAWRAVASIHKGAAGGGWRAEYRDHLNGLPRTIRLASLDAGGGTGAAFDLTLALSQVETNVTLEADAFRIQVPRTAQPISLEELRHARPGAREN
jgi:hypothetical protein